MIHLIWFVYWETRDTQQIVNDETVNEVEEEFEAIRALP